MMQLLISPYCPPNPNMTMIWMMLRPCIVKTLSKHCQNIVKTLSKTLLKEDLDLCLGLTFAWF